MGTEGRFWRQVEASRAREKARDYQYFVKRSLQLQESDDPMERLSGLWGAVVRSWDEFFYNDDAPGPNWKAGLVAEAFRLADGESLRLNDRYTVVAGKCRYEGGITSYECGGRLVVTE